MTVPFNHIPAGNGIKVPLFYAEMDNSQASYFSMVQKTLLIGQKLSSGNASAGMPYLVASTDDAVAKFGRGSMLARMHAIYRQSDPAGEIWCIAVADNASGVQASGTITVTGPATAAGTIALYIAGQKVEVAVGSSDSANTVASAINTAINAATDLPVTSAVSTNTVTLTCRWKGLTGNDISILDSFRGTAGGEALPAGISLAYSGSGFLASGTTAPALSAAITAMGDDPYDFIVHPYNDSTSLDALAVELGDTSGRWSYSRKIYGHAYSALRGTLSALTTAGALRNDQHHTIAGVDVDCPHPTWEYAASYGAQCAVSARADVARPTQTLPLVGLLAPRAGKRFLFAEQNSLLGYGIATSVVVNGTITIGRAVTTYQKNGYGQPDASYFDSETMHQSAYILRNLEQAITSKYARHKLANDGTRYAAGSAVVTPSVIRSELYASYKQMESDGIVENFDAFKAALIVERDSINPNRVNVLYTPDYVNQLRVFAVLNQFRLQFAAAA